MFEVGDKVVVTREWESGPDMVYVGMALDSIELGSTVLTIRQIDRSIGSMPHYVCDNSYVYPGSVLAIAAKRKVPPPAQELPDRVSSLGMSGVPGYCGGLSVYENTASTRWLSSHWRKRISDLGFLYSGLSPRKTYTLDPDVAGMFKKAWQYERMGPGRFWHYPTISLFRPEHTAPISPRGEERQLNNLRLNNKQVAHVPDNMDITWSHVADGHIHGMWSVCNGDEVLVSTKDYPQAVCFNAHWNRRLYSRREGVQCGAFLKKYPDALHKDNRLGWVELGDGRWLNVPFMMRNWTHGGVYAVAFVVSHEPVNIEVEDIE